MILRFDPFRELDRLTEPRAVPSMPMDAVRRGGAVVMQLDLPGVSADAVDLTIERNELTITAERSFERAEGDEAIAAERRHGTVRRQFHLGDSLDVNRLEADLTDGVLTVRLPVTETAQPRKVEVTSGTNHSVQGQLSA